jgi:hypothetical protein
MEDRMTHIKAEIARFLRNRKGLERPEIDSVPSPGPSSESHIPKETSDQPERPYPIPGDPGNGTKVKLVIDRFPPPTTPGPKEP